MLRRHHRDAPLAELDPRDGYTGNQGLSITFVL